MARQYPSSIKLNVVRARYPFLDWPGPIAFAHRGAHEDPAIGENTMAAFAAAVALGYHYLETDVHATADGVLVAFHDHVLDRVTDRAGSIGALPWTEVRRARVGTEPIPLLEELLGTWPGARVNIDPKHDASVAPLLEVLRRADAFDRVCVGAFSDRRLGVIRRATDHRVCTSAGPVEVARLRAASLGAPAGRLAAACIQVPPRQGRLRLVDRRFVAAAHRRGLQVHVWTVNERREMEALLDLGVDGIMTDAPTLLKQVLTERGAWH